MWMMQTSLFLALLFAISAGQEEKACTEVQQKLQALSEAVQVLCGSSTSPPTATVERKCNCSNAVNWTSVSLTQIGTSPLRQAGTLAYDIPSVIPNSAKEVLVLASIRMGYTPPSGLLYYIKIYTQQNSQQYEKYLTTYSWKTVALDTNSDNLWFPLTTGRQVFVESSLAGTSDVQFYLDVIGYR